MNKPNILLITSHDTGRYLGCYGRSVDTPTINKMAEDGIRCDQYFCPSPQCSPSRGSIMTGLYPSNHRMTGLAHLGFSMKEEVRTLPMQLGEAGYETILVGLSHETIGEQGGVRFTSGEKLGYDRYEQVGRGYAGDVADQVNKLLEDRAASSDEIPFFISAGLFETHRDFEEYRAMADPVEQVIPPVYLPNTPDVRSDFADFHGSVKTMDSAIDRMIIRLKETGLDKDTLVIYTTDHGIAFPRAKGTFMDAGLETSLIFYWPGRIQGGRVIEELLCNIDLMPTLLDLAGAEIPGGIDGYSFLPLLLLQDHAEQSYLPREQFFCELTWHDLYHPMRGLRTHRYKYVRNFEKGPSVYLPLDIHRSLSGQAVREEYYVPNVPEELYDLENDPLERVNLAEDQAYNHLLIDFREQVLRWMRNNGDPLLQGPIPGNMAPEWQSEFDNGTAYVK